LNGVSKGVAERTSSDLSIRRCRRERLNLVLVFFAKYDGSDLEGCCGEGPQIGEAHECLLGAGTEAPNVVQPRRCRVHEGIPKDGDGVGPRQCSGDVLAYFNQCRQRKKCSRNKPRSHTHCGNQRTVCLLTVDLESKDFRDSVNGRRQQHHNGDDEQWSVPTSGEVRTSGNREPQNKGGLKQCDGGDCGRIGQWNDVARNRCDEKFASDPKLTIKDHIQAIEHGGKWHDEGDLGYGEKRVVVDVAVESAQCPVEGGPVSFVSIVKKEGAMFWYELSPAGADLAPALDELTAWGLRHLKRQPHAGEPTHPEHLLSALRVVLERRTSPSKSVAWNFDLTDDRVYSFAFDVESSQWTVSQEPSDKPDLTITTTAEEWSVRAPLMSTLAFVGTKAHQAQFHRLLAQFPMGLD
jgi:hypothetical protein